MGIGRGGSPTVTKRRARRSIGVRHERWTIASSPSLGHARSTFRRPRSGTFIAARLNRRGPPTTNRRGLPPSLIRVYLRRKPRARPVGWNRGIHQRSAKLGTGSCGHQRRGACRPGAREKADGCRDQSAWGLPAGTEFLDLLFAAVTPPDLIRVGEAIRAAGARRVGRGRASPARPPGLFGARWGIQENGTTARFKGRGRRVRRPAGRGPHRPSWA